MSEVLDESKDMMLLLLLPAAQLQCIQEAVAMDTRSMMGKRTGGGGVQNNMHTTALQHSTVSIYE